MKRVLFGLFCLMIFAACEVSIKDGKVPAKYLEDAQKFAGVYQGEFQGTQMDLNLLIGADGSVQLSAKNLNGDSELIANCHSEIGKLISANINSQKKMVNGVSFALTAGTCKIEGSSVDLSFDSEDQLHVSIVKSTHLEAQDGPDHCVGSGTNRECFPSVRWVRVPNAWLTGTFKK